MAEDYTNTERMAENQDIQEMIRKLEQDIGVLSGAFGDIAGEGSEKEMQDLKASLETMQNSVSELLAGISDRLEVLQKAGEERPEVPAMEQTGTRATKGVENRLLGYMQRQNKIGRTEELSAIQKAEKLIEEMEQEKTIFTDAERNLIVNYMYKFDDMDKTRELAEKLAYMIENEPVNAALTVIDAQAEIDRLPDAMVGLSEMHEYGYTWNEMLPLTQERAMELFGENVTIYQLHADGSETLVEDTEDFKHEGMFGVEKSAWNVYLEQQERKAEELQTEKAEQQEETMQDVNTESEEMENAVFLVNYGEWKEVSELDLEQNYFAIDDPYGDGEFHLYWLQNEIKDITPAGAVYSTPEEAAQALDEVEREIANLPYNKENNIGSYMVNRRIQLEQIMEERSRQKYLDIVNDRVSYYVIEDISTWAENSPEKSKLERFDSFTEALEQFQAYRKKDGQFHDDKARTTFGVRVHGIEFDVIHARNNENVLSLDFTHSSEALQSQHFMDDLQILCNELVDKVRVQREMTPEEVKAFVRKQLENSLFNGGITDISVYMHRFDVMYEQGKLEYLKPEDGQRRITEDIPFTEWENEYISIHNRYADLAEKELSVVEYEMLLGMEPAQVSVDGLMEMMNSSGELWNYPMEEKELCLQENIPVVKVSDGREERYFEIPKELVEQARKTEFRGYEPEEMAFSVGDKFISIQSCTEGYDYSIFHADYTLFDGGIYDDPDITIYAALEEILEDMGVSEQEKLLPVDYGELMEKAEAAEQEKLQAAEREKQIISDFKAKTNEMFHEIGGLNAEDIEMTVMAHIRSKIEEYDIDVKIVDLAVTGSRCRGLEQEGSDIDIVVEYKGRKREDDLFHAFNEDELTIGGVRVDINPITEEKTGTLASYLPGVESYLEEKRVEMEAAEAEKSARKERAAVLAADVDQFVFFCNPEQYKKLVKDEAVYTAKLQKSIEKGRIKHISDFLNAMITEGIREGVGDIFGEGVQPDESMAVQRARMAKGLLDRLEEYQLPGQEQTEPETIQPDGRNTGAAAENRAKEKQTQEAETRISIKEKLAEKKAVIEKQDKPQQGSMEKSMEKKVHREI